MSKIITIKLKPPDLNSLAISGSWVLRHLLCGGVQFQRKGSSRRFPKQLVQALFRGKDGTETVSVRFCPDRTYIPRKWFDDAINPRPCRFSKCSVGVLRSHQIGQKLRHRRDPRHP